MLEMELPEGRRGKFMDAVEEDMQVVGVKSRRYREQGETENSESLWQPQKGTNREKRKKSSPCVWTWIWFNILQWSAGYWNNEFWIICGCDLSMWHLYTDTLCDTLLNLTIPPPGLIAFLSLPRGQSTFLPVPVITVAVVSQSSGNSSTWPKTALTSLLKSSHHSSFLSFHHLDFLL